MINEEQVAKALWEMKTDIENTMVKSDLDRWSYHITIYSKNNIGLVYSSRLLKLLGVKTNFIGMVPNNYKYCAFDCVAITTIFNEIYSNDNLNTEGVSILECDTMNNDDFYVLIMKDSKYDSERNIIMGYKTLHEYCK